MLEETKQSRRRVRSVQERGGGALGALPQAYACTTGKLFFNQSPFMSCFANYVDT